MIFFCPNPYGPGQDWEMAEEGVPRVCVVIRHVFQSIIDVIYNCECKGEFHSTKISGNSDSNSNGRESLKLTWKILVNLTRFSFFGNLEIPAISCSIWRFYLVWISHCSSSHEKLQDGSKSTLCWMQNNLLRFKFLVSAYSPQKP